MNEDNAKELGTDYFEVTWHSGARPSHQEWQGKVYSKKELETICGLGTVTGLCGANCYHDYYPFIPGISERSYTDEELAQMNAEENKPVKYGDKEYTKYEALQRQRKLETAMRAQRQKIHLLEEAGYRRGGYHQRTLPISWHFPGVYKVFKSNGFASAERACERRRTGEYGGGKNQDRLDAKRL